MYQFAYSPEVGNVTVKSNGDRTLSDDFAKKVPLMKRLSDCCSRSRRRVEKVDKRM